MSTVEKTPTPRPIVGVGAIVVRDGRLLVVRRGNDPFKGHWSVPGGRLEFGETLAAGAVRELQEETGLIGRAVGLCGLAERMSEGGHIVICDYWVHVSGHAEPVAGDDATEVAFVTRTQLQARQSVPLLKEFLVAHDVWEQMVEE
ncbi:MAG: NUDIX hydrolase [Euzebya sp.]